MNLFSDEDFQKLRPITYQVFEDGWIGPEDHSQLLDICSTTLSADIDPKPLTMFVVQCMRANPDIRVVVGAIRNYLSEVKL
jgi:hypothetical protein